MRIYELLFKLAFLIFVMHVLEVEGDLPRVLLDLTCLFVWDIMLGKDKEGLEINMSEHEDLTSLLIEHLDHSQWYTGLDKHA